jgi:hypothetical protein
MAIPHATQQVLTISGQCGDFELAASICGLQGNL